MLSRNHSTLFNPHLHSKTNQDEHKENEQAKTDAGFKTRLKKIGYDPDKVPRWFRDVITEDILETPIFLDTNPEHCVDKNTFTQLCENPFTREAIHLFPHELENQKIDIKMLEKHLIRAKNKNALLENMEYFVSQLELLTMLETKLTYLSQPIKLDMLHSELARHEIKQLYESSLEEQQMQALGVKLELQERLRNFIQEVTNIIKNQPNNSYLKIEEEEILDEKKKRLQTITDEINRYFLVKEKMVSLRLPVLQKIINANLLIFPACIANPFTSAEPETSSPPTQRFTRTTNEEVD